jgi:hypothetical protein
LGWGLARLPSDPEIVGQGFHYLGGAKVPKKAILTRVLPVIAVAAVLALSFFNAGKVQINAKLVACVGYGTGYGYTAGPPSITSVTPRAGGIAGGTNVTVTGQGFCNFPTGATFSGTAATGFIVNSDTSFTAVSPAHAAGVTDVQITTTGGTSAASAADNFTYTAFTRYFQWYDKASTGFVNDNIHVINTSLSTANVFVSVPGATTATVSIAAGGTTYLTFPQGTIGGPVTVNSDQLVLASQRVEYNQSFNEVWSESAAQAATTSYINWYDKASTGFSNDNIHLLNPGLTNANVTVSLTGVSVTPVTVDVPAGSETYVNFPQGTIGGPVKIVVNSGPAILASQRVQYFSTFNEVWAQPATLAATANFINWYDKASTGFVQDNVHLLNPGATVANVRVAVPNAATLTAVVAAGGETYVHFPQGTIGGPVMVTSDVAILSSQRVQYNNSFNEVWAQNATQAGAITHFSWLDKASTGFLNVNVHLLNLNATSVTVAVAVPNAATQNVTLAAGAETYVTFAFGTIGGPVLVNASAPILAAQRVQYFSTFNEIWSS